KGGIAIRRGSQCSIPNGLRAKRLLRRGSILRTSMRMASRSGRWPRCVHNRSMAIASVNPANEELIQEFVPLSADELDQKLNLASETFRVYRNTSFSDRSRMMQRA